MATQAIISIIKDNKVQFKCVTGCNGTAVPETAKELKKLKQPTLDEVYDICLKNDFGCDDCLIVQSKTEHKDKYGKKLSELYNSKFDDAQFNPRWELGIASYVEVIECGD